jgi:hypothetical protein
VYIQEFLSKFQKLQIINYLFLLLDKYIDPILDSAFPKSSEDYQKILIRLKQAPVATYIRICVLAPIIEE